MKKIHWEIASFTKQQHTHQEVITRARNEILYKILNNDATFNLQQEEERKIVLWFLCYEDCLVLLASSLLIFSGRGIVCADKLLVQMSVATVTAKSKTND